MKLERQNQFRRQPVLVSGKVFSQREKMVFVTTALMAVERATVEPISDLLASLTGLAPDDVIYALEHSNRLYTEPFLRIADLDDEIGVLFRCTIETIRQSTPDLEKQDSKIIRARLLERILTNEEVLLRTSQNLQDLVLLKYNQG